MRWIDRLDPLITKIVGIGLVAMVIAIVFGIADGPYGPERYVGGIDPVRTGEMICFASGAVLFGYLGVATVLDWRTTGERWDLGYLAICVGAVVGMASLVVLFAWMPEASRPVVIPAPIGIAMFAGFGLIVTGVIPTFVSGTIEAVRRRDRGLLVILVVAALLILLRFVDRP